MASIIIPDPSMGDLRAMLADTAPQPAKTETSETAPVEETEAPKPETAKEPVETKQVAEEKDEPLSPGVEKRIAKEVERASVIQRKIDEAVSARKAKEQELSKLTADSGTAPVKNADAAVKDGKPTKPEFGRDGQTWGQYQEEIKAFEKDYEAWMMAETERKVEAKLTARAAQQASQARWDEAVKTHGKDFPELMAKAQEGTPEGLQLAISSLENWSGVAVHLAKNPARLAEVAAKFAANPYAAVAELGRIEASLKTAPKPAAPAVLPAPPVTDGGKASASAGGFDVENASLASIGAHLAKIPPRKR